jgi:hypothetical protein
MCALSRCLCLFTLHLTRWRINAVAECAAASGQWRLRGRAVCARRRCRSRLTARTTLAWRHQQRPCLKTVLFTFSDSTFRTSTARHLRATARPRVGSRAEPRPQSLRLGCSACLSLVLPCCFVCAARFFSPSGTPIDVSPSALQRAATVCNSTNRRSLPGCSHAASLARRRCAVHVVTSIARAC